MNIRRKLASIIRLPITSTQAIRDEFKAGYNEIRNAA